MGSVHTIVIERMGCRFRWTPPTIIDGHPFPEHWQTVARPATRVAELKSEQDLPSVWVVVLPSHSTGQRALFFEQTDGERIAFHCAAARARAGH